MSPVSYLGICTWLCLGGGVGGFYGGKKVAVLHKLLAVLVCPLTQNCCFSQLSFREWLLLELEVYPEKDILSASER